MKQKYVLTLAAGITAFVLLTAGAIIGKAAQPDSVTLTPDVMEVQNLYAQREAEYQARLDEANKALQDAYAQLEAASANNDPSQSAVSDSAQPRLSPRDALLVTAIVAPNGRVLQQPELVNYQGTVAYEVSLDLGVLYIDANDGTVLYNGIAQSQLSLQTRNFHDDDEHESGETNDD